MNRLAVTVKEGDDLERAARLMLAGGVGSGLVVDDENLERLRESLRGQRDLDLGLGTPTAAAAS